MFRKKIREPSKFIAILFLSISFLQANEDMYFYKRSLLSSDKSNNFCLIVIPKNGSTTVRNVLNTFELRYLSMAEYHSENYKKILIVRDPLYRPISIYNEVMKLRVRMYDEITLESDFYKNRDDLILSFTQFLNKIEKHFYEPHITHQYMALEEKNLSLDNMDFIILFETLDQDLKLLCEFYAIDYRALHENPTKDLQKKILVNLIDSNEEIRKNIYKIWHQDFCFYEKAKITREEILKHL